MYEFHDVANIFPLMYEEPFQQLVDDIREHGLREPIYLHQGLIVDGRNRYRACEEAGVKPRFQQWDGKGSLVLFVISLNLKRRHLDPSQIAMVGADALPFFEAEAKLRQGARNDISAKWRESDKRKASEDAAKALGGAGRSIEKAKVVKEKGTPELANAVRQGKIAVSLAEHLVSATPTFQHAVLKEIEREGCQPMEAIRRVKGEEIKRNVPTIPTGKYRIIYADPPWSYGNTQPDYHTEQRDHYPVMSIQELCELPIQSLAEDNAVLFLWVTSPILEESFSVIRAWGFSYKTSFVWDKVKHNMGHYNSVRHELLLVCTRGSCQPDERKLFDSVVTEERTEHSKKPEIFYEIIETIYTHGARIELFARQKRKGWKTYGHAIQAAA